MDTHAPQSLAMIEDAWFDMEGYILDRLRDAMLDAIDPVTGLPFRTVMSREDARMIYGTRAIAQRPSRHAQSRRVKRRMR